MSLNTSKIKQDSVGSVADLNSDTTVAGMIPAANVNITAVKRPLQPSPESRSESPLSPSLHQPIPKKSAIIKTDKPRPHVCVTCTRAFARLEHLKRHERSHTNEKPFQCGACGRCFARRDLVLRHQQKLHASLPTPNRSRTRKHNFNPNVKPGDVIQDYLNENINIVYKNTNPNLPLPSKDNDNLLSPKGEIKNDDNVTTEEDTNDPNFKTKRPRRYSKNIPSTFTPPQSDFNQKNLSIASNGISMTAGNSSANNSTNIKNNTSRTSSSSNGSPIVVGSLFSNLNKPQEPSPATSNTSPPNLAHTNKDNLDINYLGPSPMTFVSTAMNHSVSSSTFPESSTTPGDSNHNSNDNNNSTSSNNSHAEQSKKNKNRHASFSAASASSYTLLKDAKNIQENCISEAPHQIGFATPQLSAQELAEKALLSGFDLDALGVDFRDIDTIEALNLDLEKYGNKSEGNQQQHHQQQQQQGYFNFTHSNQNNGHNNNINNNSNNYNSRGSTPFEFNMTPGGSVIDIPMLQQYLHIGGAGGGAGFENFSSVTNRNFKVKDDDIHKAGKHLYSGDNRDNGNATDDWLAEFINTPFDLNNANIPLASHHIGFTDSKSLQSTSSQHQNSDEITSLFRSRQMDLFKHISSNNTSSNSLGNNLQPLNDNQSHIKLGEVRGSSEFFTEELRSYILLTYQLHNSQFPPLQDLNSYMSLYELEFDKYFPFIHLSTLQARNSEENLALLLAMAAIGALYSFHSTNSLILARLSRFLIQNFMEKQRSSLNNFNNFPLHIIQALVLDTFLGMFSNEAEIFKITSRHLSSLITLVKTIQLNLALENFVLPPPVIDGDTNNDQRQLKSNYDYFIMSQSRIRTLHVLYYLSVLFASLLGLPVELSASDIKSGTPCQIEGLWTAKKPEEWFTILKENRLIIDSKFSLIQISNGEPFPEILRDLENHYCDKKLNFKTLLSALMSISERIYNERTQLEKDSTGALKATKWRMNSRPIIESLLKSWEFIFVKNEGVLIPREANLHLINETPVLKLILPLLHFAKIRKCCYLTPILEKLWAQDWNGMNRELKNLDHDPEALRESSTYALEIIGLWIEIISITNDAEKTSIRTPIFFLTCIFASMLIISEYLYATELWAKNYLQIHSNGSPISNSPTFTENSNSSNINSSSLPTLNAIDRVLWLKTENLFKKVEKNLSPIGSNNFSYSEFLRAQAKGALDVDILDDKIAQLALQSDNNLKRSAEIIVSARLSSRALSLGVRILADAPVWPVALAFAEALKARAIFINDTDSVSNSQNI
ncbi:hypothetical protein PACTADRAFT_50381 [Pachysolen tannophilus NRRL Y-2460]|uniref:C2H2-type domain-containing protein n=1 Tax=Pachysolen tannophilus NRRL Y-2460 TaxID=669874 RepID=A0A1E4TVD9_PACTA|nr:hypothetical protein PACTADRAFT_50381 [Pachysolen tannophilus NRRL Y-2460]